MFAAVTGHPDRADVSLATAKRLALDAGNEGALAFAEVGDAMRHNAAGEWRLATEKAESALLRFNRSTIPDAFARKMACMAHSLALTADAMSGRYSDLLARVSRLRSEAAERGDLLLQVHVEFGLASLASLALDDVPA